MISKTWCFAAICGLLAILFVQNCALHLFAEIIKKKVKIFTELKNGVTFDAVYSKYQRQIMWNCIGHDWFYFWKTQVLNTSWFKNK